MTTEEWQKQAYADAPEAKQIDDAAFDRLHTMSKPDFSEEPEDVQRAFFATSKYHYGKRQQVDGIKGMTIGNRTAEDFLADHDTGDGPNN